MESITDEDFHEGFVALEVFRPQRIAFDDLRILSGEFFFPPSIPPQGSQRVVVTYFSFRGSEDTGQLVLRTDDPEEPVNTIQLIAGSRSNDPEPTITENPADFNGDGRVNFSDFLEFAKRFGLSNGQLGFDSKFDLDNDGSVGFGDYLIFAQAFGN